MLHHIDTLQKSEPQAIQWNKPKKAKTNNQSKWRQAKLKFPAPRILKWNQIAQGEKYFVTFKEGGHELQCILIKKLELNHQNRFVFLRLIDCKKGSECLRFPTKFIAYTQ